MALALLGIAAVVLPSVAAPAKHKPSNAKAVKASSKGKSHSRSRRSTRRVIVRPSFQLHPDSDRYRQIQQALAGRGYFKGDANGVWGDDSVDALRRFQTAQKLTDNEGKINALSLNSLGLGAKHNGSYLSPSAVAGAIPSPDLPPPPSEQAPSTVPPPQ